MNKKLKENIHPPGYHPGFLDSTFTTSSALSEHQDIHQEGISKRLYIATKITQGIVSSVVEGTNVPIKDYVELAYKFTDELLKQEQ